jgi:hypothetical protein
MKTTIGSTTVKAQLLVGILFLHLFGVSLVHAEIDSDEPRDAYPVKYHDKDVDFVVGKVMEIEWASPDKIKRYKVAIAADMTGTVKQGSVVLIHGEFLGGGSAGMYRLDVQAGQTAVFFVKARTEPGQFDNVSDGLLFPFGVRPGSPAIVPTDVPKVAAALKEMAANLAAPGGAGMPRDRARALLADKNQYLRALACWRLVHDIQEVSDMEKITRLFNDPTITPSEVLCLDELLSMHISGPAESTAPSDKDRASLLRCVLDNQAKARIAEFTKSSPTTRP